jgi:hypothetical protein
MLSSLLFLSTPHLFQNDNHDDHDHIGTNILGTPNIAALVEAADIFFLT